MLPQVIFFAKDANLQMLSKAAQYVLKNESGLWLVVVHFFEDEASPMLQELANNISVLVKCAASAFGHCAIAALNHALCRCFPKLKTDLLLVKGDFSPANVDSVQQLKEVPKNFMLM